MDPAANAVIFVPVAKTHGHGMYLRSLFLITLITALLGAGACGGSSAAPADAVVAEDGAGTGGVDGSTMDDGSMALRDAGKHDEAVDGGRARDLAIDGSTSVTDASAGDREVTTPDAATPPDATFPGTSDDAVVVDAVAVVADAVALPDAPDAADAATASAADGAPSAVDVASVGDAAGDDLAGDDGGGVRNTIPFTGGVYLLGTTSGHVEGGESLQRFWPTRSRERYTGFHREATSGYVFRPTDGQLFYLALGVHVDDSRSRNDTLVLTPPCGDFVGDFGFDARGTLHYECGGTIRRGNGERVATFEDALYSGLAAVLGDGRVVLAHTSYPRHFEVVSPDGRSLSTYVPENEFFGSASLLPWATTVSGNSAFVLVRREFYNSDEKDVIVLRVDEDSRWLPVRRLRLPPDSNRPLLVLSDGTIFLIEGAASPDGETIGQVRAYLPDDTTRVVWRETDSVVKLRTFHGMYVGPVTPSGPALETE